MSASSGEVRSDVTMRALVASAGRSAHQPDFAVVLMAIPGPPLMDSAPPTRSAVDGEEVRRKP